MGKADNGGPAYPTTVFYDDKPVGIEDGMSLRDYFAAQCMPHFDDFYSPPLDPEIAKEFAVKAYMVADAMIAERKK